MITGSGFTTTESQLIVNHPQIRKTVIILMVIGNLGVAMAVATLIVAFINGTGKTVDVVEQALVIAVVIIISPQTLGAFLLSLRSQQNRQLFGTAEPCVR